MATVSKHLIISGRVQGVGYRAWTVKNAERLGLTGWVRNRTEGTVEAVLAGDAASVDEMIEACRKGPLAAKVTDIQIRGWDESVAAHFQHLDTL
ncbi:MAG: acylphosphatase [Rickettsiales bacterium]